MKTLHTLEDIANAILRNTELSDKLLELISTGYKHQAIATTMGFINTSGQVDLTDMTMNEIHKEIQETIDFEYGNPDYPLTFGHKIIAIQEKGAKLKSFNLTKDEEAIVISDVVAN